MSKDKTKSRALAVSLALIMLVSVAGTAFIGGAAAQSQTGGTFDQIFDSTTDAGNQLALDGNGYATLIDGDTNNDVSVQSDGRVNLPGDATEYTFDGLELSIDQIDKQVTDADLASKQQNGNLTGVLQEFPAEYNVTGDTGEADDVIPTVIIEYDPESDFSQLNKTASDIPNGVDDVTGNHDYIIVAPANQSVGGSNGNTQLAGLVDSNTTASGTEIVAVSVDNVNNGEADSSLLANASDFGTVLSDITTGSNTTDHVQDSYIDGLTFAAGTFDGTSVNIEEVKLGDSTDIATSETIHSEKIELYNGTDTTYHSSIDGALTELTVDGSGDEVRLAGGTYGAIEPTTELNISSNVTITRQGSAAEAYTRVNTTSNNAFNSTSEPVINTALNLTGAATVSDIGLNDSTPVVNISADDTTLDNVIVNSTGTTNPAIEVNNTAGIPSVTNGTNGTVITGSAVVSDTPLSVGSGTGLDLNVTDGTGSFDGANLSTNFADISNNHFIGFQTQVTGVNKSEATTIYNNNNFGVEVTDQSFTGNGGAQYADAHLSQAAVPFNGSTVNATITGVGKDNSNISGSVEAGDNAAGPGDEIQVTGGTYAGPDPVDITTSNVVVSGSGPAAVNISGSNGVVLNNADSIELSGVNVTQGNVTARSSESNVTISDVELPSASANVSIQNAYSVNVTGVTLSDARVGVVNITDALEGDLTVADTTANNVTGGSALGNSSQTAINVGNNVSVTNFDVTGNSTALKTGAIDGVNLTDVGPTGDVTVQQSQFTNLGNGTALALNQSRGDGSYGYALTVQDNTFTSNTQSFTGVVHNLPNLTQSVSATDVESAINYDEISDDNAEIFSDPDNEVTAPNEYALNVGFSLSDLPGVSAATANGSINNNTIVGANSSTGDGIVVVNGTFSQFDSKAGSTRLGNETAITIETDTEAITSYGTNTTTSSISSNIADNTLSGFSRIVESQDDVGGAEFDTIVQSNNNNFGTLVYGTNGYASDFGTTYNGAGDVDGYIPGSVNAALTLINTSEAGTSTLEVKDPSNVASGPQVYKETSTLTIPDSDGVTLTGESTSVEVRSNISIPNANALNNHAVSDLTLNHTGSGPALNVTSSNSQTTFDNLVVESSGEGLNVTTESGDVNVIELTNSELKVQSNGVVLRAGADDRDGYVIHNTSIRSTDNAVDNGYTGLNLSALDQPGEAGEGRSDLTGLNITNNYIAGFETQVEMPASSEATITALNFTSSTSPEQFGGSFDIDSQLNNNGLDTDSIDLGNNAFGQQVMVFDTTNIPGSGTSDPDGTDYANISLNDTNLYGSIDAAVAAAGADSTNVTVRVYDGGDIYGSPASSPTTYEENVDIGNNVTVRGPAYDAGSGGAALRKPGARINGTLTFDSNAGNGTSNGTANIATVTGFTVTAEDGNAPVVELTGGTGNVTIANSTVSAIGNRNLDLPEEMARGVEITDTSTNAVSTVNLTGLYVGDHNAVQTVNTSVYVDDTVNLTISDSELVGQSPATARRTTNGTGLNITDTPAAENATVTVTSSTIKNFAQAGIDANASRNSTKYADSGVSPIVLSGTTIENNDGAGVVAAGNISRTVTVNASSTVTNNNIGVHVNNENATINVLGSTVNAQNGTTAGIQLNDSTNSSSINGTAVVNNNIGLLVDAEFNGLDVTNNNFTNPTDIQNDGSTTLNATLNYFGNSNVSVNDAAGTTTIYDPMLSQDLTGDYPTDVSQTTHFAHDIEVPAQTAITVGFPAEPEGTYVDDVFRFDEMVNNPADYALYGLDRTESGPELTALTADANNRNTQVGAHDAFIVWNNKSTSFSAGQITYTDPSPATLPSPYTFDEKGVHFVAPSGYGNASTVLVDGSGGDMVATGINTQNGSNLYGVASQTNTTFSGANDQGDLSSTFVDTFKETAGNRDVHPHRGYFVIVSEDSTVSTRMPGSSTIVTGEAPTAANIDTKLNQSAP